MSGNNIYKCIKCGEYLCTDNCGCHKCGYPQEFIVHISRITSELVEREILREAEIMLGDMKNDIVWDGQTEYMNIVHKAII